MNLRPVHPDVSKGRVRPPAQAEVSKPKQFAAITLVLALLALTACTYDDPDPCDDDTDCGPGPPYTTYIRFSPQASDVIPVLAVEIADTPEERRVGLMNRETLPAGAGMLFLFPEDTEAGFWMKDTLVPLSIAFIDSAGQIIDIQDMEPLDETLHNPPGPYKYALEANQGWYDDNGIEVGDSIKVPGVLQ